MADVPRFAGVTLALLLGACARDRPEPRRPADGAAPRTGAPPAGAASPILFTDVSRALGLHVVHDARPGGRLFMPEIMGPGGALLDADGDGDLDVIALDSAVVGPGGAGPPAIRLFLQGSDGRLAEADLPAGRGLAGRAFGIAVGDVEGDADPDVFVSGYRGSLFLRNRGDGTFVEDTARSGLADDGWGTSAAFCDLDGDGSLDLYLARYLDYDPARSCPGGLGQPVYCGPFPFRGVPDRVFRNRGDGTFEDVSAPSGVAARPGKGLGVACFDADGDLRPDVLVANDGEPNFLWRNQGDGTFREEGVLAGVAVDSHGMPQASMGVAVGDCDGDGALDLLATHLDGETNTLYRAVGPARFRDVTPATGLGLASLDRTAFGVVLADFDRDGWLDAATVAGAVTGDLGVNPWTGERGTFAARYGQPDQLFRGLGGGRFAEVAAGALGAGADVGRGLAVGDVDGDLDDDLLVVNDHGPLRLLRNDTPSPGHVLRVRVLESPRGPDAHGAVVVADLGARRLVRLAHPAGSYLSSSEPVVTLGLGEATRVERLLVRWPWHGEEDFGGVDADRTVVAVRGTGRLLALAPRAAPAGLAPSGAAATSLPLRAAAGAARRPPDVDLREAEPQVARVVRQAQALVGARPDDAAAWGRLGVVLHAHLALEEAAACYERAAELDREDARWPYLAGVAREPVSPERALVLFERTLALEPRLVPALVRSGEILRRLGRPAEARARLEAALALDPRCAAAHLGLAGVADAAGDAEAALAHARSAAEAAPDHARPALEVARLLAQVGRTEAARATAARARGLDGDADLLRDPLFVQVLGENLSEVRVRRRAELLRAGGRLELARAELDRLLALAPGLPATLADRAQVAADLGDLPAALADADALVARAPDDPRSWRLRADLRRRGGDAAGAAADLAEAERRGSPPSP